LSTAWRTIVREVARRVNGVAGSSASTVETNYATSPLTATQIDSPVWNLSFLQDIAIDVHGRLALEIASVQDPQTGIGCHPWRSFFRDVTANIAHAGNFPTTGSGGKTIIGAWGRPRDASDTDQFLTPASAERVSNFKNFSGVYTNNPWLYHVNGSIVYHTTTNIVFEVCVYERADQVTAVGANGNIVLPDVLTDCLVAGAISAAVIEDEYASQVAIYGDIYKAGIAAIRSSSIVMPGLPFASSKAA
jgi:hypothetical protein